MTHERKLPLLNWDCERNFGFVMLKGERIMVHMTVLEDCSLNDLATGLDRRKVLFSIDNIEETPKMVFDRTQGKRIKKLVKILKAGKLLSA